MRWLRKGRGNMSAQQEVIKKFVESLDNTSKTGKSALNEAVVYASNGMFSGWDDLVSSFVSDVAAYGGARTITSITDYDSWQVDDKTDAFLKNYCGIDLNNEDTGALTGYDAGGSVVKNKDDVVPEASAAASYPSSSSTYINGIKINWPTGSLTQLEQKVVAGLYTWWLQSSLDLVEETFGRSYNEYDVTVNEITVSFQYSTSSWVAMAGSQTLIINMYGITDIDITDPNGIVTKSGSNSYYMDRIIAHEMTHAVLGANFTTALANSITGCVAEGLAELTVGIDDTRTSVINVLAQSANVSHLESVLTNYRTYDGNYTYAGGYMLFRYLAHQAAIDGISYSSDGTVVYVTDPFTGTLSGRQYSSSAVFFDASNASGAVNILANDANNAIYAAKGGGSVYGGEGNDWIGGNVGADFLAGEAGNDEIYGGIGNDTLWGGAGNDLLIGESGADFLAGESGRDTLWGGADNDTLWGGADDDFLAGESGADFLAGEAGNDSLWGGEDNDTLYGGVGDDFLAGESGADWLAGEAGNDTLYGGIGSDTLWGGDGNDFLAGENGADFLAGEAGSDTLWGGADDDSLYGGADADFLAGESGNDTMWGEDGADWLFGGDGNDFLAGGVGNDYLFGENDADTIYGGEGDDWIEGGAGDDLLFGETGDDKIYGGTGNDIIFGGAGNNTLYGGAGADAFCYVGAFGADKIMDYESGIDTIYLFDSTYSIAKNDSDVTISTSNGTITLDGAAGGNIRISDRNGTLHTHSM